MTWLFLMNSSEGSQVTTRDCRMPPPLGDTTGRLTSLAPLKSLKEERKGAHPGGVQGGTPLRSGTHTSVSSRGTQAQEEPGGLPSPIHACTHIPRLSCRRRLTFAIRSTKKDGISLAAVVIF